MLRRIEEFLTAWANGTDSIQRLVGTFALTGIKAHRRRVLHDQETMADLLYHTRNEMPEDLENILCKGIAIAVADLRESLR